MRVVFIDVVWVVFERVVGATVHAVDRCGDVMIRCCFLVVIMVVRSTPKEVVVLRTLFDRWLWLCGLEDAKSVGNTTDVLTI